MEMDEKTLEAVMGLIINGGDAKSNAMEAIKFAKEGDFDKADEKLQAAHDSLIKAHNSQTEMLTKEANGEKTELNLLTVHSQDHLMNGITFTDLAKEIVEVYKRLDKLEKNN